MAADYTTLAAQLERNGHDDAAKAIRELLAQVQERDRRIEALEHCIVALGGEVSAHETPSKAAVLRVLNTRYDADEKADLIFDLWRCQ